jgi:hypothetical protein
MDDRTFCQTVLGLTEQWQLESAELRPADQEVWVHVGPRQGCDARASSSLFPARDEGRPLRVDERAQQHVSGDSGHTTAAPGASPP